MVLPVLPLVAGGITAAAYLDAKYFISRDVSKGVALAGAGRTYVFTRYAPAADSSAMSRSSSLQPQEERQAGSQLDLLLFRKLAPLPQGRRMPRLRGCNLELGSSLAASVVAALFSTFRLQLTRSAISQR
jgi:hypothetical protein